MDSEARDDDGVGVDGVVTKVLTSQSSQQGVGDAVVLERDVLP